MVAFVAIVEYLIAQNDTIRIIRFAPAQQNRCLILNICNEISWMTWCCKWKNVHGLKLSESMSAYNNEYENKMTADIATIHKQCLYYIAVS